MTRSSPFLLVLAGLAATAALAALTLVAPPAAIGEPAPSRKPDADTTNTVKKVHKPYGIEKRTLWTTSAVKGTPGPPDPYRTELAFPHVSFFEPLSVGVVPGTDRFGVATRPGKIYTFETDRATENSQLLVDIGRVTYGLVFHPKFAENGYFYITSITSAEESPTGSRLSRFQVTNRDKMQADPKSETVILEWPSGGHNGGCMRFGPDGYLYLATGDGSGIADELQTGQDLSDLLGAMLRIDVDHPADEREYSIPADNPFVGVANARPEIWSYGHRQVWKFSFDAPTGNLWAGEVGQDLWEMVRIIQKGGNYGWSVREGSHPFRPERPKGPTPILEPLVEHPHSDFRSLTGGWVYHGSRLPELRGAYIYGDYDTGKIWMLRYEEGRVTEHRELCDTQIRIVDIAQDAEGEIYFVDFAGGGIHRLVPAPKVADEPTEFPQKLSETGIFASTKDHVPAPGLIPYSVNAPLWSDGAVKERFLALPGDSQIEFDVVTYPQPAPGAPPGWRFPDGTVLVKTFSLEMERGNPKSVRRLETRILHHVRMPGNDDEYGAQVWNGYTYIWNDEQTDAELLRAEGLDRTYTIADPGAPDGKREQTWHFPSRAECALCHTMSAKYALGVNTLQMNKDHDYDGVVANQLSTLDHLGVFTKPLPEPPEELPSLVDSRDTSRDLDRRARSYLHANCSHCHRKWGGGNAQFQLLATLPLDETGTLGVRPGQGKFELDNPRILVPGSPERSMALYRMKVLGLGRMPHVASNELDTEAVKLIEQWLRQLPAGGQ